MPKIIKKRAAKTGLAPGTPVYIGGTADENAKITVFSYNQSHYKETEIRTADQLLQATRDNSAITWINVEGIPEISFLESLGDFFKLHTLVLEDILNMDHRPKIEDYGDYIYVILKMIHFDEVSQEIDTEQISIVLGPGYVISFAERRDDVFRPVKERIVSDKGRIRKMKADYLAYSLLDLIVDNYFGVLEKMGDMIDLLEEMFITDPSQGTLKSFHKLKREMLFLRKSVWPLREVISSLERRDSKLISDSLTVFLRDVYDHITQIIDITETLRDMLSEMLDVYLSVLSNRINEVMKVLTIITTIFIPLSFIAGIYGMNFKHMPELDWSWGYPATLMVMFFIGFLMLAYFKRKRWF